MNKPLGISRRPAPEDYGLTQEDAQVLERRIEKLPGRVTAAGGVTGIAIGLLVAKATRSDVLGSAWIGYLAGCVAGHFAATPIRSIIGRISPRFQRFEKFHAAAKAFDNQLREAQERELRRRTDFWRSLTGHAFEEELARLLERAGFAVQRTPGSRDGGIDLIIRRAGRTTVVQCKQTRHPVGPAIARDLYGALRHSQSDPRIRADDGVLAVTGGVTSGVTQFFAGKPLRVMGLSEILSLQEEINRRLGVPQ
jgi:hypothetical protein